MLNNLYLQTNYNTNIVIFNLEKNILRVHANLIALKPLHSFQVGHKIKFSYYFLWINNLKKNNISLENHFIDKRLNVFFISNLNMIEGK